MTRETFIAELEYLLRARRSQKESRSLFARLLRKDKGTQYEARDAANVAHYEARIAALDAEIDELICREVKAEPLPAVPVYHRNFPATSEEPAEEWHEIQCIKCADWRTVEFTEGATRVTCGECSTAYQPIDAERHAVPAEMVKDIVIESLPGITGAKFLGAVPR